ncbi:MAG: hypothetical protein RSC34_03135, partial [Alistipes sp.]
MLIAWIMLQNNYFCKVYRSFTNINYKLFQMKKYFSMALLVVAGLCATSCGSDDNNENNGGEVRDIHVAAISAQGTYQEDVEDGNDFFVIKLANVKISGHHTNSIFAG